MIFRRLLAMALVILLLVPAFAPAVSVAADGECDTGEQYFPETKKCVPAVFSAYWRSHGGLAQQGLPVTDVLWEISEVDGKEYLVQYFERARFEQHPEQADPQYQVLLGLLGLEQYQDEALGDSPANPDGACAAGERFFAETRHCVPALFYTYWQGHGGLAQQGLPLSDPFLETNPTDGKEYLTQYFERARFEAHPENQAPYDVLLGLLGREQVLAKYPGDAADEPEPPTAGPGPALPAPAPPMPGEVLDTDAKPVISWSVHARYQASWDAAGRGATAYAAYANPSRWGIILNGCNSTSRYKITQYTFTIVEVNGDYKRTVSYPKVCNLTLSNALPRQGQYRVSLTLHTAHPVGPGVSLAATRLNRSADGIYMGAS